MNTIIKHGFQRPRPFATPQDDWSFPSGHSMNSFIYFGLLAYVLLLVVPRRWLKFATAASLLALVILIGCSRMYLTRHYFSDVMGGFAFAPPSPEDDGRTCATTWEGFPAGRLTLPRLTLDALTSTVIEAFTRIIRLVSNCTRESPCE